MNYNYLKFLLVLFGFLMGSMVYGQNDGFNYKSVVYNNGVVVANQSVTLRFTYYESATQVYQETFTTTTSSAGIVILNMGEGTVVSGTFNSLNFNNQIAYKVEVNIGSGYTNMGTYDFKYVPYAKHAQTASSISTALSLNDLSDGKTDDYSLFLGVNTGNSDDGNNYNVGIGQNCLGNNISGFNNVAVGAGTMGANGSGSQNTAIGSNTLFLNQSGSGNTAIGYAAMNAADGRAYNTAVGYSALMSGTAGNNNVALGTNALKSSGGSNNTAVGNAAGYSNLSGNYNVFIGNNAGYNESGSNKLYITNSSTAYPLIYGDFNSGQLTINGDLTIKDGTQGAGKIFTSDANGLGSWQNAAKTHTVFLNPAMAQPMSNTVEYSRSWGSFYIASNNISTVIIPLDLPVGASVTQVTYYFVDNTNTASIRFSAYMTTISSGSSGITGAYNSTNTSSSVQEYTPVLGGFDIVADKVYSFVIDANGAAWPGNSTLSIRGIKVIYTY